MYRTIVTVFASLAATSAGSATVNLAGINPVVDLAREAISGTRPLYGTLGDGEDGYGLYYYGARDVWISFEVPTFTVVEGEELDFKLSLPGIFALNGKQPAGLPDDKNASLYFVTDDINSATTTGTGRYSVNGVELETAAPLPQTTNCCSSILSPDRDGDAFAFNEASGSLTFDNLRLFAPNSSNVVSEPSSFDVTRVGFRYYGGGDFSYTSDFFTLSYAAVTDYEFTPVDLAPIPLPASAWLLALSVLFLSGAKVRRMRSALEA